MIDTGLNSALDLWDMKQPLILLTMLAIGNYVLVTSCNKQGTTPNPKYAVTKNSYYPGRASVFR